MDAGGVEGRSGNIRKSRVESPKSFHHHDSMAGLQREFDRISQPRSVAGQNQSVDDDFDGVGFLLVEVGHFFEKTGRSVDSHAREAVALQRREDVFVATFLAANERRVNYDLALRCACLPRKSRVESRKSFAFTVVGATRGTRGSRGTRDRFRSRILGTFDYSIIRRFDYFIYDLFRRLARDGLAAVGAVGRRERAVENAQVVVDLRHGRDNGARIAARRVLLDGDRRREALDLLDVGLLHAVEELARVGGERLDVAALSLGVERVEGEGRLAAPREPGDDGQGVAGDRDVDSLQVVDLGVLDDNAGERRGRSNG